MANRFKFEPTLDRVLVREEPEADITDGGVVIPDTARNTKGHTVGLVLAVGPGRFDAGTFVEPRIKVGDRVALGRNVLHVARLDADHVVVAEDEIAGVFR